MFVTTISKLPQISPIAASQSLNEALNKFELSEGYFSSILTMQTGIFTAIVGLFGIAIFYFFHRDVKGEVRPEVREEVDRTMLEAKNKINEDLDLKFNDVKNRLSIDIKDHESSINLLRGDIYRTMGFVWRTQGEYIVSFIWFLRSADGFINAGDENLSRLMLKATIQSLDKITDGSEISPGDVGEYQEIFNRLDSNKYRIEKENLDLAFKKALDRKPTGT